MAQPALPTEVCLAPGQQPSPHSSGNPAPGQATISPSRVLVLGCLVGMLPELRKNVFDRLFPSKEKVQAWMLKSKKGIPDSTGQLAEIDQMLVEFIVGSSAECDLVLTYDSLKGRMNSWKRAWAHQRARQMGLQTRSYLLGAYYKSVVVTKPVGWYFDVNNKESLNEWEDAEMAYERRLNEDLDDLDFEDDDDVSASNRTNYNNGYGGGFVGGAAL